MHRQTRHLSAFRYFLAHVFQFQIYDVLCQEAGHRGPLHLCDLHGSTAAGEKLKYVSVLGSTFIPLWMNNYFRILLSLGSSKPWEDILEEFAGVRTFSAQPCLKYFQPLRDYLEELVANGQLKVGWTCANNRSSKKDFASTDAYLVLFFTVVFSKLCFRLDNWTEDKWIFTVVTFCCRAFPSLYDRRNNKNDSENRILKHYEINWYEQS